VIIPVRWLFSANAEGKYKFQIDLLLQRREFLFYCCSAEYFNNEDISCAAPLAKQELRAEPTDQPTNH
jgi:hypothetical protein